MIEQIATFQVNTNIRDKAGLKGKVIGLAPMHSVAFTVDNAVTQSDNMRWWKLYHATGLLGYCAESSGSQVLFTLSPTSVAWQKAITFTLGKEGGYSFNPADPGGETKYGISKRSYPRLDIKNLTVQQAKLIYYKDYWGPLGCSELPANKALIVFDQGVLTGVSRILSIRDLAPGALLGSQLNYLADLKGWDTFGRGWAKRLADLIIFV